MFKHTVIRKIIGPRRDKEIRKWRKQNKDKLHYSYSSTNIIRVTKAWRIGLAGHVVHMKGKRNAYRIFTGKPERKIPLGRYWPRCKDNINKTGNVVRTS